MLISGLALLVVLSGASFVPQSASGVDQEGRPVDPLSGVGARATVLVFVRSDCPLSNRYAPELARLHEEFASRGVVFWLVYPGDRESVDAIRRHEREYRYPFGALRDPDFALVDLTGATVTPEVAVFDSGRRLRYRGRIDDRYVTVGRARPAATRRDLEDALAALLDGRSISEGRTRAAGCFIADLRDAR